MVELLPLAMVEPQVVEALLDAAFGLDRRERTAYRLRAGMDAIPALSFALVADGALLGTLQSWPVMHCAGNGTATPLVMVGPVAIAPALQRGGHGRMLMELLLRGAPDAADGALMMIGDPEYYGRFFGFEASATADWQLPGPVERHRLLARTIGAHHPPATPGSIGPRCAEALAS